MSNFLGHGVSLSKGVQVARADELNGERIVRGAFVVALVAEQRCAAGDDRE